MSEKTIFLCEDTMEGIFTGVYQAWASRLGHENVKLQIEETDTMELFASYQTVETEIEKAEKVARTILRKMGTESWQMISRAALSCDTLRADSIYRVLVLALSKKTEMGSDRGGRNHPSDVLKQIQNPDVCRLFELSRNVWNETHRYMGFVRFRELKNGVLFSEIEPRNQVLPLLGEHFSDRFPRENFLIYDVTRGDVLAHEAGGGWWIVRNSPFTRESAMAISETEEELQRLWRGFCRSISIQERENRKLQQQLWPSKFRKWMTEGTCG